MADANSELEAAESASVFPENVEILFLHLWCLALVVSHIFAMEKLFVHECSLVPLVACQFPPAEWIRVKTRLHRTPVWWC
jgi:hypothetical protein